MNKSLLGGSMTQDFSLDRQTDNGTDDRRTKPIA